MISQLLLTCTFIMFPMNFDACLYSSDFFASSDVPMVHHDAEKSDDPKKEIEARQKNTKGVGFT
jgi:hypothetical protein